MPQGAEGARGRRRNWLLVGVAGLATTPALAAPPETRTEISLTAGHDIIVLGQVDSEFRPKADAFGLLGSTTLTGVDARQGNDQVTLSRRFSVEAEIETFRTYLDLPAIGPLLDEFLAEPNYAVRAVGVDGGAGFDTLRSLDTATVTATGSFVHTDFEMGSDSFPDILNSAALNSRLTVGATGMTGGRGYGRVENAGTMTVGAVSDIVRTRITLNMLELGDVPQNLYSSSQAVGLAVGGPGDILSRVGNTPEATNAAGAKLSVSATSTGVAPDISVTGATLASPSHAIRLESAAVGLLGESLSDTIANLGTLDVAASAELTGVEISITPNSFSLPEVVMPEDDIETRVLSEARGLVGGGGGDRITNAGQMTLSAETDFLTVSIAITDLVIDGSSIDVLVDPPGRPDRPETGSIADVAGILGDAGIGKAGDDIISNSGSISGTAKSVVQTATVSIAVPINSMTGQSDQGIGKLLDMVSLGLSEGATSAALSFATGIDGMGGADRIEHSGNLALVATGQADTLSISADVLGFISGGDDGGAGEESEFNVSLGLDIYNTSTLGYAAAVGLSGGAGDDSIVATAGSTNVVSASAEARNLDVNVGFTTEDKSIALTGEAVYSRLWAGAEATGIAGGAGADAIRSDGAIITAANALSQSLSISADVDLVKTGANLSGSFIDTALISEATAIGIEAADAADQVNAGGPISAIAQSDAESIGVDISVTVASEKGLAGTGTATFSTTESLAEARGIDRGPLVDLGLAEPGLALSRTGAGLSATAGADLQRIAVGLNAAVSMKGVGLAATLLKADSLAKADAVAFEGSAADDQLEAVGALTAATATDTLSSITGVGIAAASQGVGAGVSLLDAMTVSKSLAGGLDLGLGNDVALLRSAVSATAQSVTLNNLNSITVSGAKDGVALGAALGRLGTSDLAQAIGIDGGGGADSLSATGAISATASSETDQVLVGVSLGGVMNGVAAGVTLIQADGVSEAVATGVALGGGNDSLTLSAMPVTAKATSDVSGTSVGVTVQGSYQGVGAGVSVMDFSTTANAAARGVDAGTGDDAVMAGGNATARADAVAKDLGVTVAIGAAVYGVGAGGAAMLGTTEASADAIAVDGGEGADALTLIGDADVRATAETERTDVAVSGSFAIGVALAGNFIDATSRASAFAAGLAGDGLSDLGGADRLRIGGVLAVEAASVATGGSYAFAIPIAPVGIGANIVTTAVEATATARGLDGGAGDDQLQADRSVTSTADAEAAATLVSAATVGLNYGDMATRATANATGLAGGAGADSLLALGLVTAGATATTDSQGVGVVLTGANVNAIGAEATASAAGLSGGEGDDMLQALKGASVSALSSTPLLAVDVALTGVSMTTVTNASTALALGLDGGTGNDTLLALGTIGATAQASLSADQVGVAVTGAVAPDLTATSNATAVGIAAGEGTDTADVNQVSTLAQALANVGTVSVSLVGLGATNAGVLPTARAFGFEGAGGDDSLLARGRVNATAVAIGESSSTTVVLTGMALGDEAARANALAAGGDGGAGNDRLLLADGGSVASNAAATTGATRVTLIGGGLSNAGVRADSAAVGLGGGDGSDALQSDDNLEVTANATASIGATDVAVAGGSLVQTSLRASGRAVGLDGGAGADELISNGALSVAGKATLNSNFLTVTGLGIQGSVVRREVTAEALGLSGGLGTDFAAFRGALNVTATARTGASVSSWSLLAAGLEGAASRVQAMATGADLGSDDDAMESTGAITVLAEASTEQSLSSIALAQVLQSDSRELVSAVGAGVRGGAGVDRLWLSGALDVRAEARSGSSSVSMSGLGAVDTDADRQTEAEAIGVDGGSDDDWLELMGDGRVRAYASGSAGSANGTLVGALGTSLRFAARAVAAGMTGGDGNDRLANSRSLSAESIALLSSDSRSLALIGAGVTVTGLFATSTATGLGGGAGADSLLNRQGASITLSSLASASIEDASLSVLGGTLSSGLGRATSTAVGLDGGEGDDLLANRGALSITSNARLDSRSSGFNVLGVSGSTSDLKAAALATGLGGGAGDDDMIVSAPVTVAAIAQGDHAATNFSAIGLAAGLSAIAAESNAFGVDAGTGGNLVQIESGGTTLVTSSAETFTRSNAQVGIGAATGRAAIASIARATGVSAGTGGNAIDIAAPLTAEARPLVSIGTAQTVFVGGNGSESAGLARGEARGIWDAGGGSSFSVRAPVTALMVGRAFGSGAASTTLVGNTNVAGRLRVEGIAEGIRTGGAGDSITIAADVRASLMSTILSTVTVTSGALFSDGIARTVAESQLSGAGIFDTGGVGSISIGAGRTVEAVVLQADLPTGTGVTKSVSTSYGKTDGLDVDAISFATAFGRAELVGVLADNGGRSIGNAGTIRARNDMFVQAIADSYGNSGVFGEATSTAEAILGGATLYGIKADKDLQLANTGVISVVQRPGVAASAFANGTGQGFVDPDARASAAVSASGLVAVGVDMTGGSIVNGGTIDVLVAPQVDRARALARRQPGEGGRVDAFSFISVAADNNSAWGIRASAGASHIVNTGTVRARTEPRIVALAESFGTGSDGDATAQIFISALNTRAIGIETGEGEDLVENSGEVEATAAVPIQATVGAIEGDGDPGFRIITPVVTTEAIGIRTGGGADQVVNSGRIDAGNGIAIDTGLGNDVVTLLTGSDIDGGLRLGSGDDLLLLSGKVALPDLVDGGTGIDQLTAIGSHTLLGGLTGFERLLKQGAEELSLGSLAWSSSGWMRIEQGSVRTVASGFTNTQHTLTTLIQPGGTNGQLLLTGGVALPRGKLVVEKGAPGPFVNGTTWDVIRSDQGLNVNLLSIVLPTPTSLVSFGSSVVTNTRLRVNVAVKPMAGLARQGEARSLATALDRATPVARGEVARTITVLQSLRSDGEVRAALSAIAPRLVPLSLQAGASALDGALAVSGVAAAGGNGFVPGLTLAESRLGGTPGGNAPGAWAASFDRAVATGGTPASGPVAGYASGLSLPMGDHASVGFSLMQQVAESRADLAGTSGRSEARAAVARMDAEVPGGLRLSAAVALGSTRFAGSRAVPGLGGGSAQMETDLPMAGADAAFSWDAPTRGAIGMAFGTRFAWRHVGLGPVEESSNAGLAMGADGGRHERLEVAAGTRFSVAEQAMGQWRLSGQLGAELVQRLGGAPETALARFRDMPEMAFELASGGAPATRLGLTAGVNIRHDPSGARFTLGAARGDARSASSYSLGAAIGLDF